MFGLVDCLICPCLHARAMGGAFLWRDNATLLQETHLHSIRLNRAKWWNEARWRKFHADGSILLWVLADGQWVRLTDPLGSFYQARALLERQSTALFTGVFKEEQNFVHWALCNNDSHVKQIHFAVLRQRFPSMDFQEISSLLVQLMLLYGYHYTLESTVCLCTKRISLSNFKLVIVKFYTN